MPIGLLKWCLEYAKSPRVPPGGLFSAIKSKFAGPEKKNILDTVDKIYSFRNEYIAHQEKELDDMNTAKQAVDDWIKGLIIILKDG